MGAVASRAERNWQDLGGMDWGTGREAIRRREIYRFVLGLRRVRVVGLSIGALVLLWRFTVEGLATELVTPTVVFGIFVPIIALDLYRVRRPPKVAPDSIAVDLYSGALGQLGVVVVTGGIESPLLFVFIALAIGGPTMLGPGRAASGLLGAVLILPWLLVVAGAHDLVPRTVPALLGLEPGFAHQLPYSITRAAVVNLACIIMFRLGLLLYGGVNRMLDTALDARREALETQRERNRELVALSSAIAHELKNPLASIHGLVQLLRRGGKNAEQRFEVLGREIERTRGILDEFLNFSRPLGPLTVKPCDVPALLTDLSALHEGLAEDAGVTIAPVPVAPCTARVDPRKLGQALVNLLQNAIEASGPGSTVRWILEPTPGGLRVGVEDAGPGMDEAVRSRATDVGATTKPGGSGIGLAVARTIAEQHGGTLEIESPSGGGCRVCLRLPAAPPLEGPRPALEVPA